MPDAGISAAHVDEAESNKVLESAMNLGNDDFLSSNKIEVQLDADMYETDEEINEILEAEKAEAKKNYVHPKDNLDPKRVKKEFLKSKEYKKQKKTIEKTKHRFETRKNHLKSFCKTYGTLPSLSMRNSKMYNPANVESMHKNMVYSLGRNSAVCAPYKTGNSLWSGISCFLSDYEVCNSLSLHKKFHGSTRTWATAVKMDLKTEDILGENDPLVLVVRHPIERAVATWHTAFKRAVRLSNLPALRKKARKNKTTLKALIKPNPFMMIFNTTILKTLKLPKQQVTELGDDSHHITFDKYVQWITTEHQGNHNMILPQFEFCDICNRNYKYIVKTRTMVEDIDYLFKMSEINEDYAQSSLINKLSSDRVVGSHNRNTHPIKVQENKLNDYIKKKLKTLSKEQVDLLSEKYKIDMEAFGFTLDRKTLDCGGFTD